MDNLDKQILAQLQYDFPLSVRPYDKIAQNLGIDVDTLWQRITSMFDIGIIRRIGASLNSNKLGFSSTLAAVSVKPELIDQASEMIASFHEVTHSYLRNDQFNVWFTIIAPDTQRINQILDQIRTSLKLSPSEILNLPMKRLFKLNARFT